MGPSSRSEDLIDEARGFAEWWRDNPQNSDVIYAIVRTVDGDAVQRQVTASGLDRLADALEVAEKRATEAEAERAIVERFLTSYKAATKKAEAERDALEEQMQDREMLVMLLRNTEQQRDAALAVIEKARGMFQNDGFHESQLGRLLSSVPADVLRERDAEKWDEGAQWAAVELGAIDNERQAWITPTDNPYRQTEEEAE